MDSPQGPRSPTSYTAEGPRAEPGYPGGGTPAYGAQATGYGAQPTGYDSYTRQDTYNAYSPRSPTGLPPPPVPTAGTGRLEDLPYEIVVYAKNAGWLGLGICVALGTIWMIPTMVYYGISVGFGFTFVICFGCLVVGGVATFLTMQVLKILKQGDFRLPQMKSMMTWLLVTMIMTNLSWFTLMVSAAVFGTEKSQCGNAPDDRCRNLPASIALAVIAMFGYIGMFIVTFLMWKGARRATRAAAELELSSPYGVGAAGAPPAVTQSPSYAAQDGRLSLIHI